MTTPIATAESLSAGAAADQAPATESQHEQVTNGTSGTAQGVSRVGWREVASGLAASFQASEVRWRPGNYSRRRGAQGYPQGTRQQMLPYIDARNVMERLDRVVGGSRWQDLYRIVDPVSNAVECGIAILIAGQWVWKYDVGYPNSADDDAGKEPLKAAYSDAFKRCGVKWGIGRGIYAMRKKWVNVDSDGRPTGDSQETDS